MNFNKLTKLRISEIFLSLQGEGARIGTPTIFIRLAGCKAKMACYSIGIKCDTEFESGQEMSLEAIRNWIDNNAEKCTEITWTGGEPTDQLTDEIIAYFSDLGYYQALETSGLNPAPKGLDFICVSPKVAEHVIKKNFPNGVHELRYVRHAGQAVPEPSITAEHYWLSPHSDGFEINQDNLNHCMALCLKSPQWKLSLQNHKIWNVL